MTTLAERMDKLPEARRKKVMERAKALIAEEMNLEKSKGVTLTEAWLSNLCERTFLKLWSWPNPCKPDGKELCDLIAVFDNHVFVFFDRESQVLENTKKDIEVTWARWKKEVIDKQIKTAKGAERYIRRRQPIFLDQGCQQPLPATVPEYPIVHKIIVAHGAENACKFFSEDNVYGSLGIWYGSGSDSPDFGRLPFCIRLERDNPIHVLDSANVEILLTELDTFSDFVAYINEKEEAIRKCEMLVYCGEEDLMAHYFLNYDRTQKRYRIGVDDPNVHALWIGEGEWRDFKANGLARRRKEANKESYFWDDLIQRTYQNALDGTVGGVDLWSGNDALLEMAKEPRMSRRDLSRHMLEAIRNFPQPGQDMNYMPIYMQSLSDPGKMYAFLQYGNLESAENHELKLHMLEVLCGVTRNNFPDVKTVVGIAMNAPKYARIGGGEHFALLRCEEWGEDERADYDRKNENFGFLKKTRKLERRIVDFE